MGDESLVSREYSRSTNRFSLWLCEANILHAVFREYAYDIYKNDFVEFDVIGLRILDHEMLDAGKKATPFFVAGFVAVCIFVAVAIVLPAAIQRRRGTNNSDRR